ncbi:DNA polymerase III subunit delta [Candidatus Pelagibacter sp.]|nr:DNA polymerase III subunit delta [Candidatus Pelagibacter sp.]
MIIKYFDLDKINIKKNKNILLYGKNEGLKKETISNLLTNYDLKITTFEEKEILENQTTFLDGLISKSLFETEKIILIKRATDKIYKILEEIFSKNIEDTTIIVNAENLEKKSKLRSSFEKSKKNICIAFYPDNNQTLSKLAYNFFKNEKIFISQADINLIINKCNGDREALNNELEKIKLFCMKNKKISTENLIQLINLNENYSVSELIDNCLAKNTKKTISILNENNFSNEDCILITRVFLNKSKKILALSKEYKKSKNIDLTISNARPPIFWKDKELTKQQIYKWEPSNIKKLIYKLNEVELLIKKNLNNSVNLITDFVIEQSS